jgi:ComF family protein
VSAARQAVAVKIHDNGRPSRPGLAGGTASRPRLALTQWHRAGSVLLDLALPAICVGCGREGAPICRACRSALAARDEAPAGVPIGLPSDVPEPLLQLEWCAPFGGLVRHALHDLKYAGERRLAAPLGTAIADRWRRAGAGGELIVHVPVHADRSRERGYDQAEALARVAARELGLPQIPALVRERATIAQFQLGRGRRAANVAGAFRPSSSGGRAVTGRWVVLVDDVVTTGATLVACAEVLLEAGALAVSAVTVARER